jgi:hypothetical protein
MPGTVTAEHGGGVHLHLRPFAGEENDENCLFHNLALGCQAGADRQSAHGFGVVDGLVDLLVAEEEVAAKGPVQHALKRREFVERNAAADKAYSQRLKPFERLT